MRDLLGSDSLIMHTDGRRLHGGAYAEAESFEKMPALRAATTADYYETREDVRGRYAPL
ncbi:hypothetical protein ACTWPT_55735 [Nonomuraea sp. 3N208]|uniref:hypothetical protein n=1 Tax=Nonomuraea sp. 3N208 TaxID=3457421 RepID=UPI003FD30296